MNRATEAFPGHPDGRSSAEPSEGRSAGHRHPRVLAELLFRRVPHVIAVSLAAGWGFLEFTDWAVLHFGLAPSLDIAVMAVWGVLVPVTGAVAWKLGAGRSRPQPLPGGNLPWRSVAVLPFADGSGDPVAQRLRVGVADDILTAVGRIPDLKVVARTYSFVQGAAGDHVATIGRRLGVRYLVEGSILVAGGRLRISTQLVDVLDGYRLWSERFDRKTDDLFRVRDEIAEAVVQALRTELGDPV
ncbi:MAG: hypothetical protein PVI57_16360 [Gemmatimonadota bacterium]